MSNAIRELFGIPATDSTERDWAEIAARQHCPYLDRKCLKNRKSQPEISIGTCTVCYGRESRDIIICPHRLIERRQIFTDCIHLLALHEPGNELHVISELTVPGGSVDYAVVSARNGSPKDFVGVEVQTLDTTGTVWPERQRFLRQQGVSVRDKDVLSGKPFGMNWKMTAKTILVQLHHKVETFQHLGKHVVLASQDCLIAYMKNEFSFGHLSQPRLGDPMHFHSYTFSPGAGRLKLQLSERFSTDVAGIATCLGRQESPKVELEHILRQVESKLSPQTLLTP